MGREYFRRKVLRGVIATKVFEVDPEKPDTRTMFEISRIIRWGGIVAFPTETVYGLGADALNPVAVGRVFYAKNRPADNPLIVHVGSVSRAWDVARFNKKARRVMKEFWPGPLTVVLKAKPRVPSVTRGGLDTVAVRMPDCPIALALIDASGRPIAAPSANLSGRPSPTSAKTTLADMEGRIEAVIDGGSTKIGIESTVIDMSDPDSPPVLLRPGGTPRETIEDFLNEKLVTPEAGSSAIKRSPGTRYRHYAPSLPVKIWDTDKEIPDGVDPSKWAFMGLHSPKIAFGTTITYPDVEHFATSLFDTFRLIESDSAGKNGLIYGILIEWPPAYGVGLGLRDRILRAAGAGEQAKPAQRPEQGE